MNLNMVLVLLLLIGCGINMGCKSNSIKGGEMAESSENLPDTTLYAILEMEDEYKLIDSLQLKFSVFNPSSDSLSFTTYHTPFEGFLNNILTITDINGKEVDYNGPMAKRVMPPVQESYRIVPPKKELTTIIDISKVYQFLEPGTYTITYNGGNVSGIGNGNSVKVLLLK